MYNAIIGQRKGGYFVLVFQTLHMTSDGFEGEFADIYGKKIPLVSKLLKLRLTNNRF
jgi:hypothetical protein